MHRSVAGHDRQYCPAGSVAQAANRRHCAVHRDVRHLGHRDGHAEGGRRRAVTHRTHTAVLSASAGVVAGASGVGRTVGRPVCRGGSHGLGRQVGTNPRAQGHLLQDGRLAHPGAERSASGHYLCPAVDADCGTPLATGITNSDYSQRLGLCLSGRHVSQRGALSRHADGLCPAGHRSSPEDVGQHAGFHRYRYAAPSFCSYPSSTGPCRPNT